MLADDIRLAVQGGLAELMTMRRKVAAEVVTRLERDYKRERDPGVRRPALKADRVDDIRTEIELSAKTRPELAGMLRDWRTAVHDMEARNAGRLRVLLGTARDLSVMAEVDSDPEPARQMSALLADWLLREWEVGNFGLDDDFRELCIVRTRRYDLLPKAWRYA